MPRMRKTASIINGMNQTNLRPTEDEQRQGRLQACKTLKPVFLLFRLVESTPDQATGPNSSQSCKRHGLRKEISDCGFQMADLVPETSHSVKCSI